MNALSLEDVTEDALQRIAGRLGLQKTSGLKKEQLIAAIKDKYPYASDLSVVPKAFSADPKGWSSPPVLVSMTALVVAVAGVGAAWFSAVNALQRINDELAASNRAAERAKKEEWQLAKVNEIVAGLTVADHWGGVTFELILSKYREEALANQHLRPDIADLQPEELKKVLTMLESYQLVNRTHDNRFFTRRTAPSSPDCASRPSSAELEQAILKVVAAEPGKYTGDRLVKRVATDTKRKEDEVYAAATCMYSRRLLVMDSKAMIWSLIDWQREQFSGRLAPGVPGVMMPPAKGNEQ